ncbi:MAG: triose-phosphate isomerase [Clostridia bacterium]|nr:triose-phosphate isomerase [Clostridia bacterium]
MRKKIIAGNWKMNYTLSQAEDFVNEISKQINVDDVDVVLCPNFVCLDRINELISDSNVKLGAQNVYFEEKGAYTGETSIDMLISTGVTYCIVGHSERRQYFNETDEIVNQKAKKIIEKDLTAIVCVGETLEQRNKNEMFEVIENQLINGLKDISKEQMKRNIVIAYEPIWAIGTGVTATASQAEEMCQFIRNVIAKLFDENTAEVVRIQYGGSVKPSNAKEILNMPNIDGALVGGASLTNDFVAIVNYD